jgi:MOSC domain-containing protein
VIPHGNVGRCVITTLNPDTAVSDLDTLRGLAAYRRDIGTTEPLAFGVHAAVVEAGRVRVGDAVSVL